ncbi:MAG: hypothetical protein AB7G37_20975, partial [Solirubrobacteraceae bacterium]
DDAGDPPAVTADTPAPAATTATTAAPSAANLQGDDDTTGADAAPLPVDPIGDATITATGETDPPSTTPTVGSARGPPAPGALTQSILDEVVAAAIAQWITAYPDADLSGVTVTVADLPAGWLGRTAGRTVTIDPTAGGVGWSILAAPGDSTARYDLMTVVLHELGHALGYGDDAGATSLMGTDLEPGQIHGIPVLETLTSGPRYDVVGAEPVPLLGAVLGLTSTVGNLVGSVLDLGSFTYGGPAKTLQLGLGSLLDLLTQSLTGIQAAIVGPGASLLQFDGATAGGGVPLGSLTEAIFGITKGLTVHNPGSQGVYEATLQLTGLVQQLLGGSEAFLQELVIRFRVSAWETVNDTLRLATGFLDDLTGVGRSVGHTLRFDGDGNVSLIGTALGGVGELIDSTVIGAGVTSISILPLENAISSILKVDLEDGLLGLPVAVLFHGRGDAELHGPNAPDARWTIDGVNGGFLTGLEAIGGAFDAAGEALTFTGVGKLVGSADSADRFVIGATGSVSGIIDGGVSAVVDGIVQAIDQLVIEGGSYESFATSSSNTTAGIVDHRGGIDLRGHAGTSDKTIAYENLEPISLLAPVVDVTVDGNPFLPDVMLVTGINRAALLAPLGFVGAALNQLLTILPEQLIVVGGTNASLESIIFAPPTGSLTINGAGTGAAASGGAGGVDLDVVGVLGNLELPGADVTINASVIAVLGLPEGTTSGTISSISALGNLGPLSPLRALDPLLSVAGAVGGLLGPIVDPILGVLTTRLSTVGGSDDGSITLNATSRGILTSVLDAASLDLGLPLDLGVALTVIVGSQLRAGTIVIESAVDIDVVSSVLPLAPSVATGVAQTVIIGSRIEATSDVAAGTDPAEWASLSIRTRADAAGVAQPPTSSTLALAATVVVAVAGTTIAGSTIIAERPASGGRLGVEITATTTANASADADADGSIVGGAVAIAIATQVTTVTLLGTTVRGGRVEIGAEGGGLVAATADAASGIDPDASHDDPISGLIGAVGATTLDAINGALGQHLAGGVSAALAISVLLQTTV